MTLGRLGHDASLVLYLSNGYVMDANVKVAIS
jgi:hypothetical protein